MTTEIEKPQVEQDAETVTMTFALPKADREWLNNKARSIGESASTILRDLIRKAKEIDQPTASAI